LERPTPAAASPTNPTTPPTTSASAVASVITEAKPGDQRAAKPAIAAPVNPFKPVSPDELRDVLGLWSRIEQSCSGNRRLRVLLSDMKLERIDGDTAVVSVNPQMFAAANSYATDLGLAFKAAYGVDLSIRFESAVRLKEEGEAATPSSLPAEPPPVRTNAAEHPLVRQATELLGARLVSVRPRVRAVKETE